MAALLVFIIATLEIVFGRKKLLESKGPLGDNVIKNPARYTYWDCVGVLWYKPRRDPRPRVYWCPGQYGGVVRAGHRSQSQCSNANLI